jgi:hypothetical protein
LRQVAFCPEHGNGGKSPRYEFFLRRAYRNDTGE